MPGQIEAPADDACPERRRSSSFSQGLRAHVESCAAQELEWLDGKEQPASSDHQ